MSGIRRAGCIAAACAGLAGGAHAQWGGSLSLQSDQRFRGVSISDDKPQAALNLNYDAGAGWYGGAMLGRAHFDELGQSWQLLGYLGRVVTLRPGLDAELGLTLTRFTHVHAYDYSEFYIGLIGSRWSARLYRAPDYFGRGLHTLYGELAVNQPLAGAWQAFAHVGTLRGAGSSRQDLRAGLAWRQSGWELQGAWVAASHGGPYLGSYEQHRSTLVLGALISF